MNDTIQNPGNDLQTGPGSQNTRRKFLNWLWALLGSLAVVEICWLGGSILKSRKEKRSSLIKDNYIPAGDVKNFIHDSVTAIPEGQFYLARQEDGSFLALSRSCTHLGCSLPWDNEAHKFICPCHGSSFDIGGEVLTPPATRGLDSYPIRIENGVVLVNIARSEKRLQDGKPRSVKA